MLQAKEYFEAAKTSSLYTQPNHLYYGVVALSTACMLIRGDGTKSLDFLRKDTKHSSHGLDFTFSSDIKRSQLGLALLSNSFVKICPNGHFSNWYSTILKTQQVSALQHVKASEGSHRNMKYVGSYEIPDFSEVRGMKKDLLYLSKRLPDLHSDLGRYGAELEFARGKHEVFRDEVLKEDYSVFTFHSASSSEALLKIAEQFESESGVNFEYSFYNGSSSGIIRTRKDKNWGFSLPDSRTTIDHKSIYYPDTLAVPEVVDLFLISYALSMLSRYFPDIWVSFLESHCKGAKLVERIVRILSLKMPNLMLNQIVGKELTISTHRPLWH